MTKNLPYIPPNNRIRIVTDPDVSSYILAEWAVQRLDMEEVRTPQDLGAFRAFGVVRDAGDGNFEPMAVVIYNWFRQMPHGNDLRVIVVAEDPKWCLPGILRELFMYPFEVAGCERLTACIRDGNQRSLKLCQGLGFTKEGTLRRGWDGKTNAIVLGMLKHECRWLKRPRVKDRVIKDGQENAFGSAASGPRKNNRRSGRRKQGRAA